MDGTMELEEEQREKAEMIKSLMEKEQERREGDKRAMKTNPSCISCKYLIIKASINEAYMLYICIEIEIVVKSYATRACIFIGSE